MTNNKEDQLKATIEEINKNYEKIKNLEKDLTENPDNIVKYFKESPYLFTTIYLSFRKYYSNEYIYAPVEIELSDNPNNEISLSYSLFKYFCNEDIYNELEESKKYDIDLNEGISSKIIVVNKILNNITKEIQKINYNYSRFIECNIDEYFDAELKNEVTDIFIYPTTWFQKFFLIPIFNGDYDNELEKIAKQCLIELNLNKN